jgi:hypothetical protein
MQVEPPVQAQLEMQAELAVRAQRGLEAELQGQVKVQAVLSAG